jgi:4a-hydroxytetrahydrobiopterin dehydratase
VADGKRTHDDAEVTARLREELPEWTLEDGTIRRAYATAGWKATLMAAGAVAHLAEATWHHPDLLLTWGAVEVRLRSHDVDGITERDFALARRIDELLGWRPGADDPFSGTPDDPKFAYLKDG